MHRAPPTHQAQNSWSLVCHLSYGATGAVSIIHCDNGTIAVARLETVSGSDTGPELKPVFLGVNHSRQALLMDPKSKEIHASDTIPEDAFAAYAYPEPQRNCLWFTNDGDKETGNDTLNCGDAGASVTVIRHDNGTGSAHYLKNMCVGRGHHVTTFTAPSSSAPHTPQHAYASNLSDGTISVIGNNPDDPASYLEVIDTINLHDPAREKEEARNIPNNAFPHGMVYSPLTGKLYNLNNGYQSIAVIDPTNNSIENIVEMKVSSNLLLSPDGRFIIGKGADRKSDADHVTGRLSVMDAQQQAIVSTLDLPDIYPSTYRFNADGTKLYVTSATTGKGPQKENLRNNVLLVFDTSALPNITLAKEVSVGVAACGRRPIAFLDRDGVGPYVFVPNPTDGTVSILDGNNENLIDTVVVGDPLVSEFSFSFWDGRITGC